MSIKDFDPNAAALPDAGVFCLPHTPDEARVVLVPVPWEVTTSYRTGTADGPAAILAASKQIDLYDVETGKPYVDGIAMLDEDAEIRAWNTHGRALASQIIDVAGVIDGNAKLEAALAEVNALGTKLNAWVKARVAEWLDKGRIVGVVGGDHSVPFGAIAAVAERHPGVGVLHVDAHADLRDAYEGFTWSHASIMFNVINKIPQVGRLVQVGIRDLCEDEVNVIERSQGRVVTFFDTELQNGRLAGETWAAQCDRIVAALPDKVYISFDIDGLDPSLCPNTGTPVPGGLLFAQATYLIGHVARSGRTIVGFDVNEVAPGPDGDEWDANVGMRLLYKLIGWTLRSQQPR
jgi:agmatinase